MSHACSITDVPRPSPSYPDTLTPEADHEITSAAKAVEDARDVVRDRLDDLYSALRKHYAEGVDIRDLVRATSAGGTLTPVSRGHVSRMSTPSADRKSTRL